MLLSFRLRCAVASIVLASACGGSDASGEWRRGPALPGPIANNAVAAVEAGGRCFVLSAMGIGPALEHSAVSADAMLLEHGGESWSQLPAPPSGTGRVAASAVGMREKLYLLGGYSIAADGSERSFDSVEVYDPIAGTWARAAPLPIPVDDAAAVAWRDRYIVVVSGWSNTGSIASVQLYDAMLDTWSLATEFPGARVFGHAAAVAGDSLLVVDGVETTGVGFRLVNQAWLATLDADNPNAMTWTNLGPHPGPSRYRAAAGTSAAGALWFHAGTEIPYNFDGLAYEDGSAAPPLATTMTFADGRFAELAMLKPTATMDHRGLARCDGTIYLVGGMVSGPQVSPEVWTYLADDGG